MGLALKHVLDGAEISAPLCPLNTGLIQELHSVESRAEGLELTLEEHAESAHGSRRLAEFAEISDALERLKMLRERLRHIQEIPLSLARSRELPPDLESVLRSEIAPT